jgi:hypothetical protein
VKIKPKEDDIIKVGTGVFMTTRKILDEGTEEQKKYKDYLADFEFDKVWFKILLRLTGNPVTQIAA